MWGGGDILRDERTLSPRAPSSPASPPGVPASPRTQPPVVVPTPTSATGAPASLLISTSVDATLPAGSGVPQVSSLPPPLARRAKEIPADLPLSKEYLEDEFLKVISGVSDARNTELYILSGFVKFSDSDVAREVKNFGDRLGKVRLEVAFLGEVDHSVELDLLQYQAILQDLEGIQYYATGSIVDINFRNAKILRAHEGFGASNSGFLKRTQDFKRCVLELKIEYVDGVVNPLSVQNIQKIEKELKEIQGNIGAFGENYEQDIRVLEHYRKFQMQILEHIGQDVPFKNSADLKVKIISDVKFVEETLQVLKARKVVSDALYFANIVRCRKDFTSFVTLEVNERESDGKLEALARNIDAKMRELLSDEGGVLGAPSAPGASPFAGVAATAAASGGSAAVPAGTGGPASVASAVPGAGAPPAVSAAGGVRAPVMSEDEKYRRAYCLAVLRTQITTASRLKSERASKGVAVTEEDLRLRRKIEDVPAHFLNYTAKKNLGLKVTVKTVERGAPPLAFTEIKINEVIRRGEVIQAFMDRERLLKGVTISIREGVPPLDHAQLIRDLRELGVEGALKRQGKAPIGDYLDFYREDGRLIGDRGKEFIFGALNQVGDRVRESAPAPASGSGVCF